MSRRAALAALPPIRTAARAGSRAVALVVVAVLFASGCARSVTLGQEEAVEVLVLDGVDRGRATCIVSALDGRLELAKITGLDVDLGEDELALLADTSARCAPALAAVGGVEGSSPLTDPDAVAGLDPTHADIEAEVYRMVGQGLDPTVAGCLIVRLGLTADPAEALDDDHALSAMIVDCRDPG